MSNHGKVICFVLSVLAALAAGATVYHWSRPKSQPPPPGVVTPQTYSDDQVTAIWTGMRRPEEVVEIRDTVTGDALRILTDVNDDGVIDEQDTAARAQGVGEIVRQDDMLCNGRGGVYDRTPLLDDDLQLLTLQLPKDCPGLDELRLDETDDQPVNLVFYGSDMLTNNAAIQWPIAIGALPFRDTIHQRVFLWLRAKDKFRGGQAEGSFTLAIFRAGHLVSKDSLRLVIVGALGDKNYFASALDYLMERDRITGKFPKMFLDERSCSASRGDAGVETFRLAVMRHALTEMNVLETYYANQDRRRGRIRNIFDAVDRNPDEDLIINGSFFQLESRDINHGRRVLGAVVNNHELSKASTPHYWQVAYRESGVPGTPDWQYKSFCLFQPDHAPGLMTLVEEPFSPNEVYVPKIDQDGQSKLPYMALGGLHQVHEFENNPGCNKACMGFVDAPGLASSASASGQKLIWLAATDTDSKKTTSRFGGEAFRQALRDSGLIIDEGDPKRGVGPGRCDFVYFDSANSVALAYKVGDAFEIPCVSGRHLPDAPNTLVNNYLMLRIAE